MQEPTCLAAGSSRQGRSASTLLPSSGFLRDGGESGEDKKALTSGPESLRGAQLSTACRQQRSQFLESCRGYIQITPRWLYCDSKQVLFAVPPPPSMVTYLCHRPFVTILVAGLSVEYSSTTCSHAYFLNWVLYTHPSIRVQYTSCREGLSQDRPILHARCLQALSQRGRLGLLHAATRKPDVARPPNVPLRKDLKVSVRYTYGTCWGLM